MTTFSTFTIQIAPAPDFTIYAEIVFEADSDGVNRAYINGHTFPSNLTGTATVPTLYRYLSYAGSTSSAALHDIDYSGVEGTEIFMTDNMQFIIPFNKTIQILINNTDGGEHPFHLHGHNFWVIATSEFPEAETLFADNYVKRDVVSVPAEGWAIIRFVSDNPGVWGFHCHIDWHVAAGLVASLIEAPSVLIANAATYRSQIPATQIAACGDVKTKTHMF